jgi:hypothetical protein
MTLLASFPKEVVAGIIATVVGGLILAGLTGSGAGAKFFRLILVVGAIAVVAVILAKK